MRAGTPRSGAGGAGAGVAGAVEGEAPPSGSGEAPWECIAAMIKGAPLCKFGRRGDPHYRNFALSVDGKYLSWYSHKKSAGASRGRYSHPRCRVRAAVARVGSATPSLTRGAVPVAGLRAAQ